MENSAGILDEDIVEVTSDPRDNLADRSKRFINMLLDTAGYYALIFITFFFLALIIGNDFFVSNVLLQYLISFGAYFFYFFVFESWLGKTPGKLITRTKVVDATGGKPTPGKIAGRSLSRLVPFDAFSFFADRPVGWHDQWSGTYVINDQPKGQ